MPLKPGQRQPSNKYLNSMAEAIENVFESEWRNRYGYPLPARGREDRKLLFVSVAQGVVKHLVDNSVSSSPSSFRVHSVEVTQVDSRINSSGSCEIYGYSYPVKVKQDSATATEPNKVVSEDGIGELEILAEDVLSP